MSISNLVRSGRGRLTEQDARVTQFGALETAQSRVQLYLQGQYSPDPLRETTKQIDGSGGSVTDTVLDPSDDAVIEKNGGLSKSLLGSPRIFFIRFSHYGSGKVVFGSRESTDINPQSPPHRAAMTCCA